MTFIERLEELRKEKGITRKKLLEDCQLGKNQIKYWETKGIIPTPSVLVVLSNYFGVSPEYLLGESADKIQKGIDNPCNLKQTLLFFFEECDSQGQLRIIQTAMNEHDRSVREKTSPTTQAAGK